MGADDEYLMQKVAGMLDGATPEEIVLLKEYFQEQTTPKENLNHFNWFTNIFKAKITTKAGNLQDYELKNVRIFLNMAEYAEERSLKLVKLYLAKKAEIVFSTSLSKQGFLIKQSITTKKELGAKNISKAQPKGGGLWGKREEQNQEA